MRNIVVLSLFAIACGDKEVNEAIANSEVAGSKAENEAAVNNPEPEVKEETRENCDNAYPTLCLPVRGPDLDCRNIRQRRFPVVGRDRHGFDRDRDGIGCEI